MAEEKKIDALRKALGEPVGLDISDAAAKLKRNLMLVSLVIIVLVLGELETSSKISIFGVSLEGVTPKKMMLGLACVLSYSLGHYLWYCYDIWGEWSVRVTGARLGFITGAMFGEDGVDYPSDPKQSTLYSWWLQESRSGFRYKEILEKIESDVLEINKRIDDIDHGRSPGANGAMASNSINVLNSTVSEIKNHLSIYEKLIDAERIPISLERFDRRFGLLIRSQNLRLLLVDVLLPILLAGYAGLLLYAFFGVHA